MRFRPVDQDDSIGMAKNEPSGRAIGARIEESNAPMPKRASNRFGIYSRDGRVVEYVYEHRSCEVGILRAVDVCGLALDSDVSDDVAAVRELGSRCVRVGTRPRRKRGALVSQEPM